MPSPPTFAVDVKIGAPEQVGLLGPNSPNSIVPVGSEPPARTPLSLIAPPTATGAEAVVASVGFAGVTVLIVVVSVESTHGVVAPALLASPL